MYELWDAESGNAIATFQTKELALAAVARIVADGEVPVEALLLGREDVRGRSAMIAKGAELLALAAATPSHPASGD